MKRKTRNPAPTYPTLQSSCIHDARRHVLRPYPDAVVERVDLAVGETAHGERGRFRGEIARGHPDGALRGFGHAAVSAGPRAALAGALRNWVGPGWGELLMGVSAGRSVFDEAIGRVT